MTNATRRLQIIESLGYKVDGEMIARENKIDEMGEQYHIRDEMIAEVAPMLGLLQSAVAGTFIIDDNGVDAVDAQRWQDEQIEKAGRQDESGGESVDVSQYFNGYKATATKEWAKRHLNES